MYELDCEPIVQEHEYASKASEGEESADLWHQRLGHLGEQQLKEMMSKEMVRGMKIPKSAQLIFCEGCVGGKMKRKPFHVVGEIRSTRRLERVHSDVCGPMPVESLGRKRYFVTFIDDFSRCCAVYFIRQKSEVFDKFKEFEAIVTNDTGNAHILLPVSFVTIAHAGLPDSYWAEAVSTAAYLKNRTATTAFEKVMTPYERWYGKKPNLSNLRVFGCMAYAHIPDCLRRKLKN